MDQGAQLRLHSLTKRQFLLVFLGFFVAFTITAIIGAAGPKVLSSYEQHLGVDWAEVPSNKTDTIVFSGTSLPGFSSFSQEIWLRCIIHSQEDASPANLPRQQQLIKFLLRVVSIRGLTGEGTWTDLYPGLERFGHSRNLKCHETCPSFVVLHLGNIAHSQYDVTFLLSGLQNQDAIENITIQWDYFSPEFTQMQIWFQFIFIVLTFITTFQFMRNLNKFCVKEWCLEQKWLSLLLLLLVLYNNPLFPLHFLTKQAWGERFFEALFKSTFVCSLLLFWLCTMHAINVCPRKLASFYLPKVLVVGLVWLSALTLLSWEEYNTLSDPGYQLHLDTSSFEAWKVVFYVSIGIYLFYLVYATIRAFGTQSPIDLRLKFFSTLLIVVVVVSCTVLVITFGKQSLEPSFVSASLPRYQNSAEFLTLIGVLNYYVYTMAYVYAPAPSAIKDSEMQSNSSFARLHAVETEEDITYSDPAVDDDDEFSLWSRSGK